MKQATLVLIIKDGKILLGEKKKGEIGTGMLVGPGGKLDQGETLVECAVRETKEELDIDLEPEKLSLVAIITFFAAGVADFKVFIYRTEAFKGVVRETEDMIPSWHDLKHMPYKKMFESDRHWFAKALEATPAQKLGARVYYKERAKSFERIEFFQLP